MKKSLLKLVALIMALSLSLGSLVACGGDDGDDNEEIKHTHSFTGEYSYNEEVHWRSCECGEFEVEDHKGGASDCNTRPTCDYCGQVYGEPTHPWNSGELTKAATAAKAGTITYTCTLCGEKKTEKVEAGTTVITRADIEDALVATAWAYFVKGTNMQYDSAYLSAIGGHYGGTSRHTNEVAPEYGTSDTTIFSVCTGFTHKVYLQTINRALCERQYTPNGMVTALLWLITDNQPEEGYKREQAEIDPITENDRDIAILRWIDYERYAKDEADELASAISLQVFNSSAFSDWLGDSNLEFRKVEGEDRYAYFMNGNEVSAALVREFVLRYIRKTDGKGNYINLRPGDLIVEDTHVLMYIGGGYVLDCNGYKYDTESGTDNVEKKGAVAGRMKTIEQTFSAAVSDYIILRPLDYYTYDCDTNPDNDIISYNGEKIEISESSLCRMQYPAMDINRTVNITPYGTATQGENLTYKIVISNKTNEEKYTIWMGDGYNGEKYTGLSVTEAIPEGTVFVSASEGYTLVDGVLSWNVDIEAGESAEFTYTVKVVADVGSTIVSDGGTVASIPSNSISNRVGGSKLSLAQQNVLKSLSSSVDGWREKYGTMLAFAEGIYAEMGIVLSLPELESIIENLFTVKRLDKVVAFSIIYSDIDSPLAMYELSENVSGEYAEVQKMLIDRYIGGYRLLATDIDKFLEVGVDNFDYKNEINYNIMEFRTDYLEAGDVIVYATAKNRGDTDLTSELASARVMVYAGDGVLYEMASDGTATVYSGADAEAILTSAFKNTNDLFFAIRPSQVMDLAK